MTNKYIETLYEISELFTPEPFDENLLLEEIEFHHKRNPRWPSEFKNKLTEYAVKHELQFLGKDFVSELVSFHDSFSRFKKRAMKHKWWWFEKYIEREARMQILSYKEDNYEIIKTSLKHMINALESGEQNDDQQ